MKTPFKTSYPTRAEAHAAALAMRAMLKKPKGWKPRLHCSEYLPQHRKHGVWYSGLKNGPMSLYYHQGTGFSTLLNDRLKGGVGGNPIWSTRYSSPNPNKVIVAQVKAAQEVFTQMRAVEAHIVPFISTI